MRGLCVCVCVRMCVRAAVRVCACVAVRVRACACVRVGACACPTPKVQRDARKNATKSEVTKGSYF